ncbi:MAG: zinc ribbon domain-containing protein [Pseudomonadota bacterium]
MSKGLRLTQKWMQRGLWIVAFVFAGFLISLGSKLVENMWDVEPETTIEQYIDPVQGPIVREEARRADKAADEAEARLDQARQKLQVAKSNSRLAQDKFDNWLATRQVTARPDQDPELLARNEELNTVRTAERTALAAVEAEQQVLLDASQARERANARWTALEWPAANAFRAEQTRRELRIFGYRLALTLPLLLIAGWLFVKQRHSTSWPFVWGFIFFALFAFFVELVPYLPSYGGYVRNIVGIVLTVVIGRYAIAALQRYLARQKAAEALPDVQRRETLRYDTAYARLAKSVCPGCERPVDLKDASLDFCPHCGIGLFDRCGKCNTRKGAFARFCFSCGTPGKAGLPD